MKQRFSFDTTDGIHVEVEKLSSGHPWDVYHDFGQFRFYGTKAELLREISEVLKLIIELDKKEGVV